MTATHTLFIQSLREQAELMDRLSSQEQELQTAVLDRRWDDLQRTMQEMTDTSEALAEVEERRNDAFTTLTDRLGIAGDFSEFLNGLEPPVRADVSDAYRDLKVAVLRLKSQTNGIDTYLRATIGTMHGVMRGLYPEHAAPVYSRDGTGSYTGGQALVVNQHQ